MIESSLFHHPIVVYFGIVVMFLLLEESDAQNITRFYVPTTSHVGDSIYLICEYNLLRGQKIYTHKWYKEEKEFWRHEPKMRPAFQYFNVSGINVDKLKSNRTHIILKNLSIESGGHYSCELSIDGTYETYIADGRMTILPSSMSSKRRNSSSRTVLSSTSWSTPVITIISLVVAGIVQVFVSFYDKDISV